MIELIIYSLAIMAVSLVGVISVWKQAGRVIERNLKFLVSFSAGVFLVVSLHLAQEAIEHARDLWAGLFWVSIGAVGILVLFWLLPGFHHHHDETEEKGKPHSHIDARRVLASDAIHNIGDGVLLAASFAVSSVLGAITALGVFVHELVQETSEFFVLRQAGMTTKRALVSNFLVSATILIGSIGGFFTLTSFEALEVPLLGIASGSFLIVVFHDLIPHSVRTSPTRTAYAQHVGWFALGVVLMFVLNVLTETVH